MRLEYYIKEKGNQSKETIGALMTTFFKRVEITSDYKGSLEVSYILNYIKISPYEQFPFMQWTFKFKESSMDNSNGDISLTEKNEDYTKFNINNQEYLFEHLAYKG